MQLRANWRGSPIFQEIDQMVFSLCTVTIIVSPAYKDTTTRATQASFFKTWLHFNITLLVRTTSNQYGNTNFSYQGLTIPCMEEYTRLHNMTFELKSFDTMSAASSLLLNTSCAKESMVHVFLK